MILSGLGRTVAIYFPAFTLPLVLAMTNAPAPAAADRVAGNLIQFNDNGAWCWYQDERVVVDPANRTMLIGSVAASEGPGGADRGGDVDLVAYDLSTGARRRVVLHHNLAQDDHNAPALLIRPDGRYLAMYSKHNQDRLSLWRVSTRPHDAGEWGEEKRFDWSPHHRAAGSRSQVTYSNLFHLSAEGRTYNFSRGINDDPSILTSTDQGDTWAYAGKLLTEPKLGYVNGYVKYASNGIDRIDFITTEHHPRDFNNSIYHGYVQAGKLHRSDGTVVDDDVFDGAGHPQTELTKAFVAGSKYGGETMTHAWTIDLHLDRAGRPYALVSARANDEPENSNFNDHRFFYARFDGSRWNVSQLAKAGARLWDAEQDYTGLCALDPSDPDVVYASTTIDPRDGASLPVHEIFRGTTPDGGRTWSWSAITQGSTVDNFRPLVPMWDGGPGALLWFRGSMTRSQHYDCAIVGTIGLGGETPPPLVRYVESPDVRLTGSARAVSVNGLARGTYDLFAFFWSARDANAPILAGLDPSRMMSFRRSSCQRAEASQFERAPALTDGDRSLYRAYLGTVTVGAEGTGTVFIDEGAAAPAAAAFAGIGYAPARAAGPSATRPEPSPARRDNPDASH